MIAITRVRGQFAYCKECGRMGEVHETPIRRNGPYCAACIDAASETEEQESSRAEGGND